MSSNQSIWLNRFEKRWVGLFLTVLLALAIVIYLKPHPSVKVIQHQIYYLKHNNPNKAYSYTSSNFQKTISLDDFETFISNFPEFSHNIKISIEKTQRKENTWEVLANLVQINGQSFRVQFNLVKEDNHFKIDDITLIPTGIILGNHYKTRPNNAALIKEIKVSNELNPEGWVEFTKNSIPKSATQIYTSVTFEAPLKGVKLRAYLTYLNNGNQIGPIESIITQQGQLTKEFSFVRGTELWPAGDYEINVVLSSGFSQKYQFTVS